MALPPCHFAWQVIVDSESRLHMVVYQRSADLGLGVPFNLASYGTMAHMIAYRHGLGLGNITFQYGDLHVYSNHVEHIDAHLRAHMSGGMSDSALQTDPPVLSLVSSKEHYHLCNEALCVQDFKLSNYFPLPYLRLPLAV
jgi:thymidylate synthase